MENESFGEKHKSWHVYLDSKIVPQALAYGLGATLIAYAVLEVREKFGLNTQEQKGPETSTCSSELN